MINETAYEKIKGTITNNIRQGHGGVFSICSANPLVLETCIKHAKLHDLTILIESTCNQVNQFGGYTKTTPQIFVRGIQSLVDRHNFPMEKILLGGDHLGPFPWKNEPVEQAMEKAAALVKAYVQAGYKKIHIDTSMVWNNDPTGPARLEIITQRALRLCKIAERVYVDSFNKESDLLYVFGSEVPTPGGQQEDTTAIEVTNPNDANETIELTMQNLKSAGLEHVQQRVIGFVVQPGVEFGNHQVFDYDRHKAKLLSELITGRYDFAFEAHSTDYQQKEKLRDMVQDHFAILKVGPALTFAMREAIFALALTEKDIFNKVSQKQSEMIETIVHVMDSKPEHWVNYYEGSVQEIEIAKKYSYIDRIRYYWTDENIKRAMQIMLDNLIQVRIPDSVFSQYFPHDYSLMRLQSKTITPIELIESRIMRVLEDYRFASS